MLTVEFFWGSNPHSHTIRGTKHYAGFKTISEYNKEIKRIDKILYDFKEYIEECPEDSGTKWNYESLKYIRNELKKRTRQIRRLELMG